MVRFSPQIITVSAAGFVRFFFAEDYLGFLSGFAVGVAGYVAAAYTDGVELGDVIGRCQQTRNLAKGLAGEVHVESGDNYARTAEGKLVAYIGQGFIKKLRFVDADHTYAAAHQQDGLRMINRCGGNRIVVVGYDVLDMITGIYRRLEYLYLLVRNLCPPQPADQLLRFPRKHRPADHLNPPPPRPI